MSEVAITLDMDWVPDCVIDSVAELLTDAKVRSTWFVTHSSSAVDRLRARPELFELGIHPNFMEGSTHGANPLEVIHHCRQLVPEAVSMRTHGLAQSARLHQLVLAETDIWVDSSIFLPRMPHIVPVTYDRAETTLVRIPFYWEDYFEMERSESCWQLAGHDTPGLQVFSFHPVHVYLNSSDPNNYAGVKERGPLQQLSAAELAPFVQRGPGTRTMFHEVVRVMQSQGGGSRLRDIAVKFR